MAAEPAPWRMELDPRLVEEAVLLAVETLPADQKREFRRGRDPLYETPDPEAREAGFRDLHARWFRRLGLHDLLALPLREHPCLARATARCLVLAVDGERDEGADLHEDRGRPAAAAAGTGPVLVIRVMPRTLLDPGRVLILLRREMMHVADMLDEAFGYRREAELASSGDPRERAVRDRYRLLWDVTVDGRLAAAGRLAPEAERFRRREFLAVFEPLRADAADVFERLFRGPRPAHRDLLALAAEPAGGLPEPPLPSRRVTEPPEKAAEPALLR